MIPKYIMFILNCKISGYVSMHKAILDLLAKKTNLWLLFGVQFKKAIF